MKGAFPLLLLVLLCAPLVQQVRPIAKIAPLTGVPQDQRPPQMTLHGWWTGEFQSQFDRWYRTNFGFRNSLVRIRNQKDFALYGKMHGDDLILGKEGYLFQKKYLIAWSGEDALGDESIRVLAGKLLDVQNDLNQRGKTFIVALAPGKGSFFPEYVPERYAAVRQHRNNGEKMGVIFQDAGINLINYNDEYAAQRKTAAYPLFGKTGIHWSNYGTALSIQKFIARVEQERNCKLPNLIIRNVSLSKEIKDPDGDLGRLANLMIPIPEYPMGIVDWEWESPEGREQLKMTVIADSFFQQFLNFQITPGCFRKIDYFFYNTLVMHWPDDPVNWVPATKEAALKSVDDADVVLIMATEMNYSGIGFGYLEALQERLQVVRSPAFNDGGFESQDGGGPAGEWIHFMSNNTGKHEKCTDSPRSGNACVRISGTGEWGVLASKSEISAKHSPMTFQAQVRVVNGRGRLQIDYLQDGKMFANSFSQTIEQSNEWSLVTLRSDPALLAKATSVKLVLAALGGGEPYVVDFDDVELYFPK